MTATSEQATHFSLALTEEERSTLLNWLEQKLINKRVEEHRTEASDFQQYVRHEEDVLEHLIAKLRRS